MKNLNLKSIHTKELVLKEKMKSKTQPKQERPQIIINRQLHEVSTKALDALYKWNIPPKLFRRTGEVVRTRVDEMGRPIIETATESILRRRLTEVADFYRESFNRRTHATPSIDIVRDILATEALPFPALESITEIPVMREDGSILDEAGYDGATRLYYHPAAGFESLRVSDHPSAEEVHRSVELIGEAIGEFPFAEDADRANAFATLLSPFIRATLGGTSPLALINAPQQGTGKGLLTDVAAYVATGRRAAMMAAPDTDEEWRKRLTATLYSGASLIVIDNIEGRLEAPSLASALTAPVWRDRMLGASRLIEVPQRSTWLATGNNIRLGGDLQRRCYWVRLDAKMAQPWLGRSYRHANLLDWVAENRPQLVGAFLTIIRAWYVAGRPVATTQVLGGFEKWCRTVGGILEIAEVTGFLGNLQSLYEVADEETAEWEQFLLALAHRFPKCFSVKSVVESLKESRLLDLLPEELDRDRSNPQSSFSKCLGKAFSRRLDRRYGSSEARLERVGDNRDGTLWRVAFVQQVEAA